MQNKKPKKKTLREQVVELLEEKKEFIKQMRQMGEDKKTFNIEIERLEKLNIAQQSRHQETLDKIEQAQNFDEIAKILGELQDEER